MLKILYCSGCFSTYNARFVYTQETDNEMMEKQRDIIEVCSKYKQPLHIKVHPSDEKANFAHFELLAGNYPNTKVIGGYWRWGLNAEKMIPFYGVVILDIIRTALLPVMMRSTIPCILYTKKIDLLKKWGIEDLKKYIYVVSEKEELDDLIRKFSFRELYLPKEADLLHRWFKKREVIQRWYKVGLGDFILRRKFRHEWNNSGIAYVTLEKLWQRIKRRSEPPVPKKRGK